MSATEIKTAVASLVASAIKRDLANRYSLLEAWRIPVTVGLPFGEYEFFAVEPRVNANGDAVGAWLVVKSYTSTAERNICDGATLSPDKIRGILAGAIFHDPWYLNIPQLAVAWQGLAAGVYDSDGELVGTLELTERNIRKLGDEIFENIIRAEGGRAWVARVYYTGVRYGYPCFKLLKTILEKLG